MKKKIFYGSPNKIMDFMLSNEISATIYIIANTLFMLEKKIKRGDLQNNVSIDCYVDLSDIKLKEICSILNNLVLDVLCEDIKFKLVKKKLKKKTNPPKFKSCDSICLFSGGIDSTLGILKSKEEYKDLIGLYVAHQDMGKITHKVEKINKNLVNKEGVEVIKLIAPAMGKGYSQVRGLLYILYASIVAYFIDAKRIIVSECGVTMYQPKFAPMDTITYTTHPLVLRAAKKIAEIIIDRKLDIILPFEDFTKTEMMTLIKDDSILSQTHSCISGRWDRNCGTCYACIARMIGSVNLDLSIDYFKSNIFEKKDEESLSSLIAFCLSFELNKENLDYWSLETIKIYEKEDLFRRFCQDVFLCLKKLRDKGELDITYEFVLDHYLERKDELGLILREKQLKGFNSLPNFDKKLGD